MTSSAQAASRQRHLGGKGLIVFLALLSGFIPLSTDLYLPALPAMTRYFGVAEYATNLTLILFFIFYAVATLVWGPLSDKYGRRPILIVGLSIYAVSGTLCAFSPNVYVLLFFRAIQAIGAGAAAATATAIVKDVYQGRKRESVLAIVQSMMLISPAVGPVIGALLLRFTSWRGAFVAQGILGLIAVCGALAYEETLVTRGIDGIVKSLGRLLVVLNNVWFDCLVFIFAVMCIADMAFIAGSPYIYQDMFGVSSQVFSYYFTLNAIAMILSPYLYLWLSCRYNRLSVVTVCFAVLTGAGALIAVVGRLEPWLFALTVLPATVAITCMFPPATYLILDQQRGDAGSASALMVASQSILGSVGILLVSFDLGNKAVLVGLINVAIGVVCGLSWIFLARMLRARETASVVAAGPRGS
jgi:MFS transporter, DHA1 family, multidrug resistance protein